jgi:hypothetical protein
LTYSPGQADNEPLFSEERMTKTSLLVLFLAGSCFIAQSALAQSQPSTKAKGQTSVEGCLSRQNGDYILTQTDPGNSYVLHGTDNVKLGQYLGQQVKVTGTKSSTLSDSSDTGRSTSPVTITVSSVKTISKECNGR